MKSKKKPDRKVKAAPKKPRIAVLIADDHSVVREGLVSLIRRKPDMLVVAEASNGREAVDLWKQHRPDVTLLDLRMPELDGVGAIKEIRAANENAWINAHGPADQAEYHNCADADAAGTTRSHVATIFDAIASR